MITEKNLELLDNYIGNRLNGDDKAAFEKQLEADTELQQEFHLQQNIVEGLRQSRIVDLKNMLNNVPTSALRGSSTTAFMKAALGIVASGVVATILYFYIQKPEEHKIEVPAAQEAKDESSQPVQSTETLPQPETPVTSSPVEERKVVKTESTKIESTAKPAEVVTKPSIEIFEPVTEPDSLAISVIAEKVPTEKVGHGSIALGIDKSNKKYTFHYQFKDDSLLLFGPFEKNVYEIMEFFSDEKRTIFLFYKDHYYFLKEESDKVKPLKAISDPALIKKLRESR